MLGEREENDHSLLPQQAKDIADAGFAGVMLVPRAGRLDTRDPAMLDLFERAAHAAKSNTLAVWVMADPRLASDSLIAETGDALEVILINRRPDDPWNGENLNVAKIRNGSYTWKLEYSACRPTHMHVSGAITYLPVGIERVFAFNRNADGTVGDIREITQTANLYHGVPSREIEVHGEVDAELDGWEVIAFPRFRTNFFDYSSKASWPIWKDFMDELFQRIENISGVAWDEPGFYTEFGKFPAGERIFERFREHSGYDIRDELPWLLLDSSDMRHVRVRTDYYRTLNRIIVESMQSNLDLALELGGESIAQGIHATWHGEFCGLEEMSHGSLDIWSIRPTQTASFTDVGAAERLMHPEKSRDIIYSLILARSLARVEPNRGLTWCNLWSVDFGTDDSEAPAEILDYQKQLLELFSARWLAHGYGWTGTKFMDHGFGPGYPDHPTWSKWSGLNSDFRELGEPVSDVLMVFPLESFYAIGHDGANSIGMKLIELVAGLTRAGYQLDIVSPEWLSKAEVGQGKLLLNGCEYKSLILPYCRVIAKEVREVVQLASEAGVRTIVDMPASAVLDPSGERLPSLDNTEIFDLMEEAFEIIVKLIPPTFSLPEGSICTVRQKGDKFEAHVIADRPGGKYGGTFSYRGKSIEIPERTDPFIGLLPSE